MSIVFFLVAAMLLETICDGVLFACNKQYSRTHNKRKTYMPKTR